MSWPVVKLGDICTTTQGVQITKANTKEEPYQGGYRYLYIADFMSEKKLSFVDDEFDHKKVTTNDLVMANTGSPGRVFKGKDGILSNNLFKISFDNNSVDRDYLYMMLSSNVFQSLLQKQMKGGIQKHLGHQTISRQEIPLPPLDEQKRIAAILDKADAIRRKRQQAIQLADDFLRSVFLDMFGDPVTNPKGWEVKKFGEVIDVLTDYHANGSYKTLVKNVTLFDEPNYAYMVRTTDLEKKNYTESVKYIDQHAYEHLSKSKVFGGEIIMNKIGSAGAVYLMPHLNKPVSLAMNQFMIRCNKLSTNEFMYYQLKTAAGAREIAKRVQGAVTKTITKDAVRDVSVIVPPIELQNKFIVIVNKIKKLKIGINDSYELTKNEFNSLSQKAFAGEL